MSETIYTGVWLAKPSLECRQGFSDMLETYRERQDEKYRDCYGDPGFDFDAYVLQLDRYSRGEDLPERWVPTSTFWLTDGSHVFGTGRVRHHLNEWLINGGGNIGYDIHPRFRMQGYGTLILKLLLVEAGKLGIRRALVTCGSCNEGSRRIIDKNGGVLENKVVDPESGNKLLRFWINT